MMGSIEAFSGVLLCACRIGLATTIASGGVARRAPTMVRLLVTMSIVWMVAFHVAEGENDKLSFVLVASEMALGAAIGYMSRVWTTLAEVTGSLIATALGLNGLQSQISAEESVPVIVDILSLAIIVCAMNSGMLDGILIALIGTYDAHPIGVSLGHGQELTNAVVALRRVLELGLHLAMPFICVCIVGNMLVGIVSRITPQLPMQFVASPALAWFGVWILFLCIGRIIHFGVDINLGEFWP